jgi:1-acyl-sn-glycerol-3-phosphate acyltransferase
MNERVTATAPAQAALERGGLLRSFLCHTVIWSGVVIFGTTAILLCPFTRGQIVFWLGRLWSYINMKVSGVRWAVEGREHVQDHTSQVLIGNHTSNFDIFITILALKGVYYRFLVKREALFLPIFGWALWAGGFPFLDRRRGQRAVRTLSKVARRIKRTGMSIVGFPEGTRNTLPRLLPFKKGSFVVAIELGAPVIPFAIVGARAVQGRHEFRINPGTVRLKFFPPIPTEGMKYGDRDALIEKVRNIIENELNTGLRTGDQGLRTGD